MRQVMCLLLFIGLFEVLSCWPGASGGKGQSLGNSEEVTLYKTAIEMPTGRFLLARRDLDYCAIIFTKTWTEGKNNEDHYAAYNSYCQTDKTGIFGNKNVRVIRETLSFPKPLGIGRLTLNPGNKEIQCGFAKLL